MEKNKIAEFVGKKIRKHRESLGFSQETFSTHISFDCSNFGAIERGERNISICTLARIAKGLDVSIVKLFPSLKQLDELLKK